MYTTLHVLNTVKKKKTIVSNLNTSVSHHEWIPLLWSIYFYMYLKIELTPPPLLFVMATCTNKEQFSIGSPLADSIVMCLYPEMEIKTYF